MPDIIYVWDPIEDNVIRERDEDGNTIVNYTTEPTLYGQVLSQDRGGQVRHYHYDGQGNTVSLTDASGNVTDTRKYSAFGEVTESTGTTEFSLEFGGQFGYSITSAIGLGYVRRRYFGTNGRWLSCDPLAVQNEWRPVHAFVYGANNPINWSDPTGLWAMPSQPEVNTNDDAAATDFKSLSCGCGEKRFDAEQDLAVSIDDVELTENVENIDGTKVGKRTIVRKKQTTAGPTRLGITTVITVERWRIACCQPVPIDPTKECRSIGKEQKKGPNDTRQTTVPFSVPPPHKATQANMTDFARFAIPLPSWSISINKKHCTYQCLISAGPKEAHPVTIEKNSRIS